MDSLNQSLPPFEYRRMRTAAVIEAAMKVTAMVIFIIIRRRLSGSTQMAPSKSQDILGTTR